VREDWESLSLNSSNPKPLLKDLRESAGFPVVIATLLTVVVFVISYWFEATGRNSDFLFRGIFLAGAILLCGMVIYGVLGRHFIAGISHLIVTGAAMVGLSQLTAFLEVLPSFRRVPVIGPEGWGYLSHLDDMLLYPGFVLMLCGFYLTILHATQMRMELMAEGQEKEQALALSNRSAEILARRVAFENLATGISTRFINLGQDEIDDEIRQALELVGSFTGVDRVYFVVSRVSLAGKSERFEWHGTGVKPLSELFRGAKLEDFKWSLSALDRGECIVVPCPGGLPPEAAYESGHIARHGIQALIRVPVVSNRRLRGYIGLDSESKALEWPEETIPLLRMIGEILLSAWDRRCVMQQRAQLEFQVQQAQKMESLGVMAGGIAHDFNNILTGIMGNAELAQLGLVEGDDRHRYLEGITLSARRAAELCRQMLAYSGRGKFFTEKFALNNLVSEMTPLLRASVNRLASLECELATELPELLGDTAQFRQILVNLIANASESLEEKPGTVKVTTGSEHCSEEFLQRMHLPEPLPPGDYVYLEVSDTGSGMSADMVEKIFDPFFTTRFAGRGLGLPAVLGIVRSHKGAIQLDTAPGKGTRIRLYFPVPSTITSTYVASGEVLGDWHGHGSVLLADDEEMVVSVGTMMLKHIGLDVVTAADGEEALTRAVQFREQLQCIILDLSMPHMNGDATCAEFKKLFPDIPIVISSGYMRDDIEHQFSPGHVAAFLPKPFELFTIQSLMRDLLEPVSPP
jgi:signal transduction histidine kinase